MVRVTRQHRNDVAYKEAVAGPLSRFLHTKGLGDDGVAHGKDREAQAVDDTGNDDSGKVGVPEHRQHTADEAQGHTDQQDVFIGDLLTNDGRKEKTTEKAHQRGDRGDRPDR